MLTAFALAEFDLVLQARFNPTSAVVGRFTHVVFDDVNGFYAAGTLGVDGVIAKFDANRNLVAYQRWDHPKMVRDCVEEFEKDSQGRLYVTFSTDNGSGTGDEHSIVQYSKTLKKNWEHVMPTPSVDKVSATLPTGETGIAWKDDDVLHLRILSAAGVVIQDLSMPSPDALGSICAVPTLDSSRGFAISGRLSGHPWFARFNTAGQKLFEATDLNGPNMLFKLYAEPTGLITGMGKSIGAMYFAKVSATGELTFMQDFGFQSSDAVGFLDRVDAVTARVRCGDRMVDFNTQSLAILRRYIARDFVTSWAQVQGGNLLGGGSSSTFQEWTGPGLSVALSSQMSPDAGGLKTDGTPQFVGWNPTTNRPAVSTERIDDTIAHEDVLLAGYSHRTLVNSTLAQNGDVAILSRTYSEIPYQTIPSPYFLAVTTQAEV